MRALAALMLCFATTANAQIDGQKLGQRIENAQNVIWPEEVFTIRFEGCDLWVRQATPDDRSAVAETKWHLADFETAPAQLEIISQNMADDTTTWINSSVLYPLRDDVRAQFGADIARYEAALTEVEELGTGFWGWLKPDHAVDQQAHDMMIELADKRRAGDFGPLLQRNSGVAEGRTMLGGPYYQPHGLVDTVLGFRFRDDVRDKLLDDIHTYRLENCPPAG